MVFRTLDAASADGRVSWLELWRRWPTREVQAHPDYARLFVRPCDRVVCAVGEDAGGVVLFPLILRPLAAEPWARRHELGPLPGLVEVRGQNVVVPLTGGADALWRGSRPRSASGCASRRAPACA